MSEYTGSALYLKWNSTEVQAHYRTFTPSEEGDTVDASAGSDTHRTYLLTLLDGAASLEMVAQAGSAGTALWDALAPSATVGTLEWGPEGTAAGKQKATVDAILTSRTANIGYADVVTWNVEWSYSDSDGPTYGTY